MKPAKALALIVPAGLVLGMAAGAASRPVMVERAKDYWPASVAEARTEVEAWRPIYEGGPEDLTPARYSYRPALDYDALAWPDQEEFEIPAFAPEPAPVQVRRGPVEVAADNAEAAVDDALAAGEDVTAQVAASENPTLPAPVAPISTGAF